MTLAASIFKKLDKPALPAVPRTAIISEFQKKFFSGSYTVLNHEPIEIYCDHDTLFFQELHSQRIPFVFHVDGWASLVLNDTIVPGVRLAVQLIDNQKVLCQEVRDSLHLNRMIVGNHFSPTIPSEDKLKRITGAYLEMSTSGVPFVPSGSATISIDSLSQSKAVFLKMNIGTTPRILNSVSDTTFIAQGLGRAAQETARITNDTVTFAGLRFVKSGASLAKVRAAVSAADMKTPMLKSAEDVIQDLKKDIEKSRFN